MYFDRKCKITFICNGTTIYSNDYRFTDAENYPPLNDYGQEEIEKVCEYLKKRGVKNNKIYSSPALRTKQSADLISKLFKQDYEIIEDLHPRKCGSFNGLTFEQVAQKHPDLLKKMIDEPQIPVPDDAEAISDFIKRVSVSINDIIEQNIGNRIIIVTHRDIIKAAVCSALNMQDSAIHRIYIQSGSISQISYFKTWASLIYCDYKPL